MAKLGIASARPRATMVGQLAVSITATIVASMILAGLQQGLVVFRGVAPQPELTSGGKFAARVEALRAAADEAPPAVVSSVPLRVADAGFAPLPMPLRLGGDGALGTRPIAETAKPPKRTARAEPRHRAVADATVDVLPPKRSDNVPVAESAGEPEAVRSEATSVWSTTKALYKQAMWLGGTVLDRVNPSNLLP